MASAFPVEGVELAHMLVVRDVPRARAFYRDVLGARVDGDSATTCVMRFQGARLMLVTGSGPGRDKPGVNFAQPASPYRVSHIITIRVPDCQAAYETLKRRGATFLTPPIELDTQVRCFFHDPDGHMLEITEPRQAPPPPG
jgi:catechol 2,3-dioxygenase-like lactoylglutathione lyase family enzyme